MLIIKIEDEQYTIKDDYKILGKGKYYDFVKSMVDKKMSETTPSSPCVIDSLHDDFEDLGIEILLYQQEFDKDRVY